MTSTGLFDTGASIAYVHSPDSGWIRLYPIAAGGKIPPGEGGGSVVSSPGATL